MFPALKKCVWQWAKFDQQYAYYLAQEILCFLDKTQWQIGLL